MVMLNTAVALSEHEVFVERKKTDSYNRNAICRAICTVKRGLRMPGAQKDGKAFVPDNWDTVFKPALGAYLKFLLSRPDQFRVVEGSSPGQYTIENVTMNKTVVAPPFFAKGKAKGKGKDFKGKGKDFKGKGKGKSFGKDAAKGKGKTIGKMFSQIGGKGKVIKGGKGKANGKTAYYATEEAEFEEEAEANDDAVAEEMPEGAAWADQVENAREQEEAMAEEGQAAEMEDFEVEGNLEDVEDEFDVVEMTQEVTKQASAQEGASAENVFNWSDEQ